MFDRSIPQGLLDRYHLNPAECLFIDDTPQNVAAAKSIGINSRIFA